MLPGKRLVFRDSFGANRSLSHLSSTPLIGLGESNQREKNELSIEHGVYVDVGLVTALAYSRDGRLLASASKDFRIRVRDDRSGITLVELVGHRSRIYAIRFSADAERIFSVSNSEIILWEVNRGRQIKVMELPVGKVEIATLSPSGEVALCGYTDGTARLLQTYTGTLMQTLGGHKGSVRAAQLLADGSAMTGADDETARHYGSSGQCTAVFQHGAPVWSVWKDASTGLVYTGGKDRLIRCFSSSGELIREMPGHAYSVTQLQGSASGELLSGAQDGLVRFWRDGRCRFAHGGPDYVRSKVHGFLRDGRVVRSSGRSVYFVDSNTGNHSSALIADDSSVSDVCVSDDERLVAVSNWGSSSVSLFDVATGNLLRVVSTGHQQVRTLTLSEERRYLATADECYVEILDLETNVRRRYYLHAGEIYKLILRSGVLITGARGCFDQILEVNPSTGTVEHAHEAHTNSVLDLALSSCSRWLVSCSTCGEVFVWDRGRKRMHRALPAVHGYANNVAISENGNLIAIAGGDGQVSVARRDGTSVRSFRHRAEAISVAISSDAQWLASTGIDQRLCVWSMETGSLRLDARGDDVVSAFTVHPSGHLVKGGYCGIVRKFHPDRVELIKQYSGFTAAVGAMLYDDRCHHLYVSGNRAGVSVLDLSSGETLRRLGTVSNYADSMGVDGSGRLLAIGSEMYPVVYKLPSGLVHMTLGSNDASARVVCIEPSGRGILSGSSEGVRHYHVESGATLAFIEHPNGVTDLCFAIEGGIFLTACKDGLVRRCSLTEGEVEAAFDAGSGALRTIAMDAITGLTAVGGERGASLLDPDGCIIRSFPHESPVTALAISDSGLFTGTEAGQLYRWDLGTGDCSKYSDHKRKVSSLLVVPDRDLLISGSWDHTVGFWTLDGELRATYHNVTSDEGFLWTTPAEPGVASSGWVHADQKSERLIDVVEKIGNQRPRPLVPGDIDRQLWLDAYKKPSMVMHRINDLDSYQREIRRMRGSQLSPRGFLIDNRHRCLGGPSNM